MRKNIFAIAISFIILLSFFAIYSCEEEETNHEPTCTITSPVQDSTILKGETITITANADDQDGNLKEVRFYIDNTGVSSTSTFPYTYEWNTSEVNVGTHTLKAEAVDDNNAKAESSISIELIDNALTADFTADKTVITVGDTINFTDLSETMPYEWNWSFGDGGNSTEQNPSYRYANAGLYTISLSVSNNFSSDTETKSNYITVQTLPTISTANITEYTSTTIIVGGNISNDGFSNITERGVYYGTTTNPEIDGTKFQIDSNNELFSDTLKDLDVNTTYYIRAYATNTIGTNYGNIVNITTEEGLPILTTTSVSDVTAIGATCGGEITDDGDFDIIARGVCWSTNSNPTISDNNSIDGTGTGSFNSNITNLEVNTTYYVRAYATNAIGTGYGNELNFTTEDGLPTLTTAAINNITVSSAESGGNITDNGGFPVITSGVCWSTTPTPTVADYKTTDGVSEGNYTSNLTSLTDLTLYYVRAYATNEKGTSYGDELTFSTYGTLTDIDGNIYKTVLIGNQIWMAENLKTQHYANGNNITYYYYDNLASNGEIYGALYTWNSAMNGAVSSNENPSGVQGACPDGWHMPSESEWFELFSSLGDINLVGEKLKDTNTQYWNTPNYANNESKFSALGSGTRHNSGSYGFLKIRADIWSSTENATYTDQAYQIGLIYNNRGRQWGSTYKDSGSSIRCVKD